MDAGNTVALPIVSASVNYVTDWHTLVGITTHCKIDGSKFERRCTCDFPHPSRSAQTPVHGYRVSFLVVKRSERGVDHLPLIDPR
jgi:hypothetical protein